MNIYNMTVAELIELGANVDVNFHNEKSKSDAYDKVNLFSELNNIEQLDNGKDLAWFQTNESSENRIEVTAFYDK